MFECNYEIEENVVSRTNQDGTVIIMKMDEGSTFFKINGIAAEIWKELSKKKAMAKITTEIINSYNATEEKIESDVQGLIKTLLSKELIKKV